MPRTKPKPESEPAPNDAGLLLSPWAFLSPGARLLTEEQAATFLGQPKRWMKSQRDQGTGPRFTRVGRAPKYFPEDLEDFARSKRVTLPGRRSA